MVNVGYSSGLIIQIKINFYCKKKCKTLNVNFKGKAKLKSLRKYFKLDELPVKQTS